MQLGINNNLKKNLFLLCEKIGIHFTPVHYESPIPDTRELKESVFKTQSQMVGVDMNEQYQFELLDLFSSRYKKEYDNFPKNKTRVPHQYYLTNPHFKAVDAEILYCMIRYFKPKRIIEIGSGDTTYLNAQAIQKNLEASQECELTAIEPHPNSILRGGFPGLSKLISKKVQDVPLSEFSNLTENDILFIDSSHVLKIGGDVQYEMLEILPRLKNGVLVHFHDIFLPHEYPHNWVLENLRFFNEQYMVQAFLAFNNSFKVEWAGCYMGLRYSKKLENAFGSYDRNKICPGSFWIRKTK